MGLGSLLEGRVLVSLCLCLSSVCRASMSSSIQWASSVPTGPWNRTWLLTPELLSAPSKRHGQCCHKSRALAQGSASSGSFLASLQVWRLEDRPLPFPASSCLPSIRSPGIGQREHPGPAQDPEGHGPGLMSLLDGKKLKPSAALRQSRCPGR